MPLPGAHLLGLAGIAAFVGFVLLFRAPSEAELLLLGFTNPLLYGIPFLVQLLIVAAKKHRGR